MLGNLPDVVDCDLCKHERFGAGPQAATESDDEHNHVAVKVGRVHAQCLADDWNVGQRRVDDAITQPRIALQYEPQNGREHQQQRKDREEPVVGEQRGMATGAMPPESVDAIEHKIEGP